MNDFPFNRSIQELILTVLWLIGFAYSIWMRKWKALGLFCLGLAVIIIPLKLGIKWLALIGIPVACISWLFAIFMAFDD